MNRVTLSALVLALTFGGSTAALAKNHDRDRDRHVRRERIERREHFRDRNRWEREHREHERSQFRREQRERDAMRRYDREHHRPTSSLREHPSGWEQGHKTGWHNASVPPRNAGSRHYERPGHAVTATAPVRPARGPVTSAHDVSMNARTGPVVR